VPGRASADRGKRNGDVPGQARDCRATMRWPGRQRRVLSRLEKRLLVEDRRLGSMFAFFTKLSRGEAMPATEQIEAGPLCLLRVALAGRSRRLHEQASAKSTTPGTP
jgi:hypothetical protein